MKKTNSVARLRQKLALTLSSAFALAAIMGYLLGRGDHRAFLLAAGLALSASFIDGKKFDLRTFVKALLQAFGP